jgi:molybdopterin/thiamine biosynthesis adenylyltransferase
MGDAVRKVVIVGVGALGSHVLQFSRGLGVTFLLVDFDRVEQKNVTSQFHGKPGVGKNKVQALQQTMQLLWGLKVGVVPHKLTSENDDQLLSGSDLLVDCLDNGPSRRLVQGFARRTHTPCLHGALAANGVFGRVVWDEDFVIDDADEGAATCEDGAHLPFIVMVSSCIARSVQEFLDTGKKVGFQVTPLSGASRL